MNVRIEDSWKQILQSEFEAEYFAKLKNFLLEEKRNYIVYPKGKDMFKAFDMTPFHSVRVVILGQDPYHGDGQAHGLCFSVPDGIAIPPSLMNIYKEIEAEVGTPVPQSGNLEHWAKKGVLLLNATLSVRANQAGSHQNRGWEIFTDRVIRELSIGRDGLIFMLWGSFAIKKAALIDPSRHYILTAPHPSPLSAYRGFFGCGHFAKVNELLQEKLF